MGKCQGEASILVYFICHTKFTRLQITNYIPQHLVLKKNLILQDENHRYLCFQTITSAAKYDNKRDSLTLQLGKKYWAFSFFCLSSAPMHTNHQLCTSKRKESQNSHNCNTCLPWGSQDHSVITNRSTGNQESTAASWFPSQERK